MTNTDAEVAVIGACLLDATCVGQVADFLTPEDFYREEHQEIYRSTLNLFREGAPISDITVSNNLKERKKLKTAGGVSYISEICDLLPDTANVDYYAKKVKDASALRSLRWLGKDLESSDENPHEIMARAMNKLSKLSASTLRSVPHPIGEVINSVVDRAVRVSRNEETKNVVMTGFPLLDKVWGGLSPSDLIIIGAQPSVGKSAFSLVLSKRVAIQGIPVLFISLEMSEEQVAGRLAAEDSGVPYMSIQDGCIKEIATDNLGQTKSRYATIPFIVDDKSGQSINEIRTKAMREQAKNGLGLLVVDYLQIAAKDPSDVGQVAMVSAGLKGIAKDLKIPVIAVSQLSRNIDHRDSSKPRNSDLKQSSQLEQDADIISFMWHPDKRKRAEVEVLTTKHRNGPLGRVLFNFEKENQRFEELSGEVG